LDRIFLDANVFFSAACLELSGLARLWTLEDVELLSSAYAVEEARRNLAIYRREALAVRQQRFQGVFCVARIAPCVII